jgi:hypothetical protein
LGKEEGWRVDGEEEQVKERVNEVAEEETTPINQRRNGALAWLLWP